jgi:hypothetical protein
MKQTQLIIFLFLSKVLFSQTTGLETVELDTSLHWSNSTSVLRDSFYFDLPVIENSNYETHFRISMTGQKIDFYSSDNISFEGLLTNVITKYTEIGEKNEPTGYVFQKIKLDSAVSISVAKSVILSGQGLFPTDTLIPSWHRRFLHCSSLEFEFKLNRTYSEQSFLCPWGQPDTTKFAKVIVANHAFVLKELDLERLYDDFKSQLPKGRTYSRDEYIMQYFMTDKQAKAWNEDKPRREYLKSIKDTVDSYLRMRLKEIQATSDSINSPCYSAHLTFGRNGKLKEIKTNRDMKLTDGLSWYIEDLIEDRRCKKAIKHIFKKIDLSSFNFD